MGVDRNQSAEASDDANENVANFGGPEKTTSKCRAGAGVLGGVDEKDHVESERFDVTTLHRQLDHYCPKETGEMEDKIRRLRGKEVGKAGVGLEARRIQTNRKTLPKMVLSCFCFMIFILAPLGARTGRVRSRTDSDSESLMNNIFV